MTSSANKQVLNDDGTVRRRYEPEDITETRHVLFATIGLVCASAFILVKNVLFGANPQPYQPLQPAPEKPEAAANHDGVDAHPDDDESASEQISPEAAQSLSDGDFARLLMTTSHVPLASGGDNHGKSPVLSSFQRAGNDNATLYGAPAGNRVSPTADGDGLATVLSRGSVGGGGAGSDVSTGGGGGDKSDDAHDDDDHPSDDEDGNDDGDDTPRLNRAPVVSGPVNLGNLFVNQTLVIAMADLLAKASDPDGDAIWIQGLTVSSGHLTPRGDTAWLFTPEQDDTLDVTFSYAVSDGTGATLQTAVLDVVPTSNEPILGTHGDDRIIGTPGADTILALAGDDVVVGLESSDVVFGGDGNDRIVAGAGSDVVYGGDGNDVVFAGDGNDVVYAGNGDDIVFGEAGDDTLFGEAGGDVIEGGDGRDVIDGGTGSDVLTGGASADTVLGGDGDDLFIAKDDDGTDDVYDGGAGIDTLDLSGLFPAMSTQAIHQAATAVMPDVAVKIASTVSMADTDLTASPPTSNGVLSPSTSDGPVEANGKESVEQADAAIVSAAALTPPLDTSADCVIDLEAGTATGEMLGNDVLIDIENVIAGVGNDIIIANDKQNDLSGGDGEDTFVFHTSVAIGNGHGSSDRILDFAVGDRIDLDQISNEFADLVDAAFTDQTMQKFMIISGQSQFATPGQLRVKYDVYDGHDVTILEGNVDFDEAAEFALEFLGHHQLDDYRFSHAISHGSA